ncbi:MAG: CvpA family protein [Buchnera aphidicola (Periphyllus lyropictus)]|uniref:CvpA family protein n=1 Tax=Buchnera aphidicola TaxID=9 RepID=UPI001EC9A94C|nr:CvpA family protein [Buchnera aphidicola]NIH16678.1 CvpA family protein [Buchnera aphidicola (Periphyllus lyropictus)]USS94585.1 CvpA family protein [Buchnera aphidicola (Periphyllus lyropictus)]
MNLFDYFFLFIIFTSTTIGLKRGFFREVISLSTLIIVFYLAYSFYDLLLIKFYFIDNFYLKNFCYVISVCLLILFLEFFLLFIFEIFFKQKYFFGINNFLLGFILGFFRAMFLIFLFILFFNEILHINISSIYLKDSIFIMIFYKLQYKILNFFIF